MVGLFASRRKQTSMAEYFLGNRQVPWLAATASMVATGISCKSLIGLPGLSYTADLTYLQMYIVLPLAALIAATVFLPFYSRIKITSAYEYLGRRFGPGVQSYASLIFQIETALVLGTVIAAPSLVMSEATGLSYEAAVAILLVATLLYTSIGGMKAVVWTDVVQFFVFASVPVVLLAWTIGFTDGGLAVLWETAGANGKLRAFNFSFDFSAEITFWAALVSMLFWHTGNQSVNQVLIQRYMTAPSQRDSRRTILLSSVGILSLWVLFLVVGVVLFAYNTLHPGAVPAGTPTDRVFTAFVMATFPTGVKGAFIAAAFAAGMSTLSSMLNSMGTVTLVDVWKLHFDDQADELRWIRRARGLTLLWGAFSFAAALFVLQFGTVITAGIRLGSVITGGLLGMFLLGIFVKRSSAQGVVASSVLGMASVVFVMGWSEISWSWYCGIGTLVTFVSGWVAARLAPAPDYPEELTYAVLRDSSEGD
jgi:SSS family transporter